MNFFCLPLGNMIKGAFNCLTKPKRRSEECITVLHQNLVKFILAKKWKKAKELIQKGADINHTVNKYGEPVLFLAKDVISIRKILELGADINARDYSGEGILGHAILHSWDLDAVSELIKQGAYVGARNNLYISPLERAVAVGNNKKIKLLIENGACCCDERLSETPMNYCINNFEGAKTVIKHVMLKYFEQDYASMIGLENYNYPYIFKNYEHLKQFYVKCEIELQRMKTVKISGNGSLFDLLRGGTHVLSQDTTEIQFLLFCLGENTKKTSRNRIFPIYQDLIVDAVHGAIKRQKLLQQLEQLDVTDVNRHLSNEALLALIKCHKKRNSFRTQLMKVGAMLRFRRM